MIIATPWGKQLSVKKTHAKGFTPTPPAKKETACYGGLSEPIND